MALIKDNPYRRDKGADGTLATAASAGITLVSGFRPSVQEFKGEGAVNTTIIDVPGMFQNNTGAFTFANAGGLVALGIGQKIYTFPKGVILPLAAEVDMKSTMTTNGATAGEVGLGTVVASGAVAVLSGTATFNNFLKGQTLSNHVAGTQLTSNKFASAGATSGTELALDGSVAANDLYLNLATTFAGNASVSIDQLRITLHWVYLGAGVF